MLSSARFNQALPWLALTILAAVCALIYAHARETPKAAAAPCTKPLTLTPEGKKDAQNVARRFIINAAFRKNPGKAWNDATASLRQGMTRKQWAAGSIPVPHLPPEAKYESGRDVAVTHSRIAVWMLWNVDRKPLVLELVLVRSCAETGWRVQVLSPVAVRVGGSGSPALP